jgi:hypothetical protein
MATVPKFTRPTFDECVAAWKSALSQRGLPDELLWIFDENLCFEPDPRAPDRFKLGFQTRFTPPPPGAEQIAFEHFSEFGVPIVFYRLGSWNEQSVCLLLCDEWFRSKTETDGYLPRQNWLMSFRPGGSEPIEEITSPERRRQRIVRNRPVHDLDFCMTLRAIHEILAHGRVLTSYEHYALRFLHALRRLLTESE